MMRHRRRIASFAGCVVLLAALLPLLPRADAGAPEANGEYTGSEQCASCHQIQYKGWVKTFHSTVVQDARENPSAILADMSVPGLPFAREDIAYTIGGHWDQRYLTRIGDDYYILPRLWSVQSRKWRPYSTYGWKRRPYSRYCVGCHSVGFDPKTKGIVEHSVGCESCHGPGKQHVESPGRENIVNPKRLPEDRSEEVCASCHVRGRDPSGEYYFPIGYTPGDDLSKYLIPLEKKEGENYHDAIHRLWDKWRSDREAQARSRCEVCGIHQNVKPKGPQVSLDAICMSCHEYDDRLPEHTHHKADTTIGCADCHVQRAPELNETKENNVHSYSYFLIHPQNCWDRDIYKRCANCHEDKTEKWAYDIFISWKKPVVVDH
ncbi:MAG: hypothetical protein Kow00128_16260 [Deltaproteobacteria bacterium]